MLFSHPQKRETSDQKQRDGRPFYLCCGFLPNSTHRILPTLALGLIHLLTKDRGPHRGRIAVSSEMTPQCHHGCPREYEQETCASLRASRRPPFRHPWLV